jgi:hypothetical protein
MLAVAALEVERGKPLAAGSVTWVSWHDVSVHGTEAHSQLARYARRKLAGEFDRKPAPFRADAVEVADFGAGELAAVAAHTKVDVGVLWGSQCAMVAYAEPAF